MPDLEARVTQLEQQLNALKAEAQAARDDAAAARHLAAASDRDVAEIRDELRDFRQASLSTLNAQRADLADLREEVRAGFAETRGKLDGTAAGIEQISTLLTQLIERDNDSD